MTFHSSRSIALDFIQGKKSNNKTTKRPERSTPLSELRKLFAN